MIRFLDFSINISQGVQRPLLADIIQVNASAWTPELISSCLAALLDIPDKGPWLTPETYTYCVLQEHEQSQAHAFFALNNGLGKLLGYGLGSLSLVSAASCRTFVPFAHYNYKYVVHVEHFEKIVLIPLASYNDRSAGQVCPTLTPSFVRCLR